VINELSVRNFKSIRELRIECNKINIFIGEPNSGKSNILESIGLLSYPSFGKIKDFIRMDEYSNLFFDYITEDPLIIKFDGNELRIIYTPDGLKVYFNDGTNDVIIDDITNNMIKPNENKENKMDRENKENVIKDVLYFFRYYMYEDSIQFKNKDEPFLYPPKGVNLPSIIASNQKFRYIVSSLFEKFGYRLVVERPDMDLKVIKDEGNIIVSFPFELLSDTLKRLMFYLGAIYSNNGNTIIFNEPESNAFPFYTKYLAEIIALNENINQYFISTHNPYFLLSIMEKSDIKNLNVFITYMDNYQTNVRKLSLKEMRELLDQEIDIFFNLNKFTK